MFSLKAIIHAFNRAAATYATAIALPHEIGQRLLERLTFIRLQPNVILELGCATGHLSQPLQQHYPKAQVLGIDVATPMLTMARRAARWRFKRPSFCGADMHALPLHDNSVDLIFANLTIAWSHNIDILFQELKRVLKPDGLLLFTTLGPDTLQELRKSWQSVDDYCHVHPFLDMHDIGDSLIKAHFLDPVMDMEKLTVNYSTPSALMRDLKNLGMQNTITHKKQGLTTPRQLTKLVEMYKQLYETTTHQTPATFEVIYGHAWAPLVPFSSMNEQGTVVVPLQNVKKSLRRSN